MKKNAWGTQRTLWAKEAGLQIPLRRGPPRTPGSQSPPLAARSTVPSAQERTCLAARARTHTHTHTHTQHRLACLHTRVPVLRLSPSGLCTPCLHDLTFRQNNTQGARLPVSPRSTPPPPPPSPPSGPDPRSRQPALQGRRTKGAPEQLAGPEGSLALQTPGDGGWRGVPGSLTGAPSAVRAL